MTTRFLTSSQTGQLATEDTLTSIQHILQSSNVNVNVTNTPLTVSGVTTMVIEDISMNAQTTDVNTNITNALLDVSANIANANFNTMISNINSVTQEPSPGFGLGFNIASNLDSGGTSHYFTSNAGNLSSDTQRICIATNDVNMSNISSAYDSVSSTVPATACVVACQDLSGNTRIPLVLNTGSIIVDLSGNIANIFNRLRLTAPIATTAFPWCETLSLDGSGNAFNMNVNGSVTPQNFKSSPLTGSNVLYVSQLNFFLTQDGTGNFNLDENSFARSLTALAVGLQVFIQSLGFSSQAITTNARLIALGSSHQYINTGSAAKMLNITINFRERYGFAPRHIAGDEVIVRVLDDLTAVTSFRVVINGWKES
jgi:hypothetical protein